MLLEGQVDWVLLLAIVAGVSLVVALGSVWFAVTRQVRHASTSDELDLVQKVAAAADKRLMETLNAIPVALVETDRQGKFVFANKAAHQLLGRRDAELIGLRFHSATWGITFPDGRPVPPDLLPSARALRGQTVKGFQHLIANPATRRKMLVSVTAMPIEDEKGAIIGSTAAMVESDGLSTPEPIVIEPAAPEDGLTRRVFEVASSALAVVDASGVVREANPSARTLTQAEPTGLDFADLFVGELDRAAARQAVRQALTGQEVEAIEAAGPDGQPLRWTLLSLPGGPEAAVLLAGERVEAPVHGAPEPAPEANDAAHAAEARTEAAEQAAADLRAELERLRQETARETEAGRRLEEVGRLTGGVAHDFNALLGVMTSALDMMLKQADDPSRVRRLGQAALAAGQRGEALTRRLSAFSQGQDAQGAQVLDAGVLLRGLEGRLRGLAGPGVDLMIEGPSGPAAARIDPVAFDGAVEALTRNAVEAVAGQGSVAVRLESLVEGLRLSVRDSGPGFEEGVAGRALEPFFTTRTGSAGLGLAQAYGFARQSGGALNIDSRPGEGAEVSITLPPAA